MLEDIVDLEDREDLVEAEDKVEREETEEPVEQRLPPAPPPARPGLPVSPKVDEN